MPTPLPIAIVLPHSGLAIPPEWSGRTQLSAAHLFNEADIYADQLFDFREQVLIWESFPYARALIDVNRPDDDVTAAYPHLFRPGDGIIKRRTSYGQPVFLPGAEPDAALERQLIAAYWQTWQDRLAAIAADPRIRLVIDAHSMAAFGPSHYSDPAQARPRFELANLGDGAGEVEPLRGRTTAPAALLRHMAGRLAACAEALPTLTATGPATALNTPFWGGWDIWGHGGRRQPWVMVEVSRALYVGPQSGETPPAPPRTDRIDAIRACLWTAIATAYEFVA